VLSEGIEVTIKVAGATLAAADLSDGHGLVYDMAVGMEGAVGLDILQGQ
jgi:hypothetical protein